MKRLSMIIAIMENDVLDADEENVSTLKILFAYLYKQYRDIIRAPEELNNPLTRVLSRNRSIDSFEEEDYIRNFRFSKNQLKDIIKFFQMPVKLYSQYRHVFCSDSIYIILATQSI